MTGAVIDLAAARQSAERLDRAAKAAFEQNIAQQVAAGRYVVGDWGRIDESERHAWRAVVGAAVEAWERSL